MRKVIRKISAAIVATTITVAMCATCFAGTTFEGYFGQREIGTKELTVVCQAQQQVLSQLIWMRLAGAVFGEHRHTETSQ